jgi:hypothetical protein
VRRLLVTASVVPSSLILVTLMKEALRSSETLVLTRATRRNIPDDTILYVILSFVDSAIIVSFSNCAPLGARGSVVVKTLSYNPEGRGLKIRGG